MGIFYNYSTHVAESHWARRSFLHQWWTLYASDWRWTPPLYGWLYHALVRGNEPHLVRCQPSLIHLEATVKRSGAGIGYGSSAGVAFDEKCVAACVVLTDPRCIDGTAYLALLHCANDEESLERLVGAAWERAAENGAMRLIGPTGLAPRWGAGVLLDHFNRPPPLHSPYNPPYVPEIVENVLSPHATMRLYELPVSTTSPDEVNLLLPSGGQLMPLHVERLAGDLAPLIQEIYADDDFPAPDAVEIDFLLRSWQAAPLFGWLAQVDDEPVGFILSQPDHGADLRRAGGGKAIWRRLWLHTRRQRQVVAGRVLMGGVASGWRGRGIGRALLRQTITSAADFGWRTLAIGPVPFPGATASFLEATLAQPVQTYGLYATEM